jgi:hypothetical protein
MYVFDCFLEIGRMEVYIVYDDGFLFWGDFILLFCFGFFYVGFVGSMV